MKRNVSSRGFTLVELLVVIGIIALLISILLPTLGRARDSARGVKCASNARQLAQALVGYSTDFQGQLPIGSVRWGFGDGDDTPASRRSFQEWTISATGYMNNRRENGYELPFTAQAIIYTDPNENYHPVLYCPNVGREFDEMQGHYSCNMSIMPNWTWDLAGSPSFNSLGVAPVRGSHKPLNMSQTYADNALFWDSVQVRFATNTATRSNSIQHFPSPAYTGIDNGVMAVDMWDFDVLYRHSDGESIDNLGDPDRSVEFPVYINSDELSSLLTPVGTWPVNEDLIVPGSTFKLVVAGAPIFRHNAKERCNTAFADGSVRALKWNPRQEHPGGVYVTSEMQRTMLRPKYPNPLPKPMPS